MGQRFLYNNDIPMPWDRGFYTIMTYPCRGTEVSISPFEVLAGFMVIPILLMTSVVI